MPLIRLATSDGHEIVVIEQDEDIADATVRAFDCMVVNADATSAETFDETGLRGLTRSSVRRIRTQRT